MGEIDMTSEQDKWTGTVLKLTRLTQDGFIDWQIDTLARAELENASTRIHSMIYKTNYADRWLRLYKRTIRKEHAPTTTMEFIMGRGEVFWEEEIILEFISEGGSSLWAFPPIDALEGLLSAVQYQAAGVQEFIDNLLKEPESLKNPSE
jgi:hypothetical protein